MALGATGIRALNDPVQDGKHLDERVAPLPQWKHRPSLSRKPRRPSGWVLRKVKAGLSAYTNGVSSAPSNP
ncbi:hypothetical protein GCM10010344_70090 [Streptomyces bluensis]|nr:hypothetical protein GCM10010344_70090 [Streptomyces bluensis]